ncbi:MAG: DUF547 domain-containing protein, partial [Armatimonadetes bacterium]|nr:DUF547 domain-containing protein [Armatimonadota bacterium]
MNRSCGYAAVLAVVGAMALVGAPASDASRSRSVDSIHMGYYEVLRKNVIGGKVNYERLKAKSMPVVRRYQQELADEDPNGLPWQASTSDAKLAFWLNAYNACVIVGIVEHYPGLKSVRDIPDFFEAKRWVVHGRKLSLNEIENDIIRAQFKEPRVHL